MRLYVLASLPMLDPELEPPLSSGELMERCAASLPALELLELQAICATPPSGDSPFAFRWRQIWSQWRSANDAERMRRLDIPQGRNSGGDGRLDVRLLEGIDAAWEMTNPMEREKALQRLLWQWLDDARQADPYSFSDLAGYALQLRLLERRQKWSEHRGEQIFNGQVNAILDALPMHEMADS